jgi:hypothetical protein
VSSSLWLKGLGSELITEVITGVGVIYLCRQVARIVATVSHRKWRGVRALSGPVGTMRW